jgi:aryl-alcohol dehydrogenase-like predicted oxidoreductase
MKYRAMELGCTPSQWVLRWVMNQSDKIIPVIAASSIEQLLGNTGSLSFQLD